MTNVFASAQGDSSALMFWTAAGPVVAAVVGVLSVYVGYYRPRGHLYYSIMESESLTQTFSPVPGLDIMYRGRKVKTPYRVTIRLANIGGQDIEFHSEEPMILEVGTKIVEILSCSFSSGAPPLGVVASTTRFKVGPGPSRLIRKGEIMTFILLVEGPPGVLKGVFPFKDAVDREVEDEPMWVRWLGLATLTTWIAALILYLRYIPYSVPLSAARSLLLYLLYAEFSFYLAAICVVKYQGRRFSKS